MVSWERAVERWATASWVLVVKTAMGRERPGWCVGYLGIRAFYAEQLQVPMLMVDRTRCGGLLNSELMRGGRGGAA